MTSDTYILSRTRAMKAGLEEFERKLTNPGSRTVKSLYGILGDVDFTPEEIDAVKSQWNATSGATND